MTIPTTAPPITEHELLERDSDETFIVTGKLLGFASSETNQHSGHSSDFAPRGVRCSACRWFEVRIIEVDEVIDELRNDDNIIRQRKTPPQAQFLVHTVGRTEIPHERQYVRVEWCAGGPTILNALTVRKKNDTFMTGSSHKALAMASEYNDDIRDAYENRPDSIA